MDVALAPTAPVSPDRVREELRGFEQALAASPELSFPGTSAGSSGLPSRAITFAIRSTDDRAIGGAKGRSARANAATPAGV